MASASQQTPLESLEKSLNSTLLAKISGFWPAYWETNCFIPEPFCISSSKIKYRLRARKHPNLVVPYDLNPEDPNQWEVTDGIMAKSVELQLNLLLLSYGGNVCDKMFEVFAESQTLYNFMQVWACGILFMKLRLGNLFVMLLL